MKVGVLGNGGTSVFDRFSFSISVIVNTQIQKTCPDLVKKLMTVPGSCSPAASNGLLPAESSAGDF